MIYTYTSPLPCSNVGVVTSSINEGSAQVIVLPENFNCFTSPGSQCTIQSVPYGVHTIQVTTNSFINPNVTVNVAGQIQSGIHGTFTFTVTTSNGSQANIPIIVTTS